MSGPGCCSACDGTGGSVSGPCTDCYATGCCHPESLDCVGDPLGPTFVIDSLWLTQRGQWAEETFGPGTQTDRYLSHILKEVEEVRSDPRDVVEWADIIILAFEGARRAGHPAQVILDAIRDKQERNLSRHWPNWRDVPDNQPIEHIDLVDLDAP